jgi:hypothetical protein
MERVKGKVFMEMMLDPDLRIFFFFFFGVVSSAFLSFSLRYRISADIPPVRETIQTNPLTKMTVQKPLFTSQFHPPP